MNANAPRVLLIGYGNPGRCDDGLGPAFARALEGESSGGLTVESNYQLTVEDADAVARHDVVVFADAAVDGPEPFAFRPVEAGGDMSFSTHSIEPEGVLALAQRLFGAETAAYTLGIRGYVFNRFGETLSAGARENLAKAVAFFRSLMKKGNFEQAVTRKASLPIEVRPSQGSR